MRFFRSLLLLVLFANVTPLLGAPANISAAVRQGEQGTVVRGDQEAPLVLFIVPWQEPKTLEVPPPQPIPLLPKVFDHDRSLVDDPVNRSIDIHRPKNK